jgi:DNA repair photolyase
VIVREIQCKSILTHSGIAAVDYAVNPYVGCQHGCAYCYAVFMKRFTGHREAWGQFVDVKVNAAQVLARQLRRAKPGNVTLGTVTDAYQPQERKYRLTRACLEALLAYDDFPTSVLTKSAAVLLDLDILCQMKDVEVAFTITTQDDAARQALEPFASPIPHRLTALARLHEAGIRTWAFFGPVLPGLSDSEEAVDAMFAALAKVGVSHVLVDTLNLRGAQWGRLQLALQHHYPHLLEAYRAVRRDRRSHATVLAQRVAGAAQRHQLPYELAY